VAVATDERAAPDQTSHKTFENPELSRDPPREKAEVTVLSNVPFRRTELPSSSPVVVTQLDDVVVGISDVQRGAFALSAEALDWALDHIEPAAVAERLQVRRFDHETEVIGVLTAARCVEQVDDRHVVHAHRREWHLISLPLLDPHTPEAELMAVEVQRAVDVGDVQHDVVQLENGHGWTHRCFLPGRR